MKHWIPIMHFYEKIPDKYKIQIVCSYKKVLDKNNLIERRFIFFPMVSEGCSPTERGGFSKQLSRWQEGQVRKLFPEKWSQKQGLEAGPKPLKARLGCSMTSNEASLPKISRTSPNRAMNCRANIQSMRPWETFQMQTLTVTGLEEASNCLQHSSFLSTDGRKQPLVLFKFQWCCQAGLLSTPALCMLFTGATRSIFAPLETKLSPLHWNLFSIAAGNHYHTIMFIHHLCYLFS